MARIFDPKLGEVGLVPVLGHRRDVRWGAILRKGVVHPSKGMCDVHQVGVSKHVRVLRPVEPVSPRQEPGRPYDAPRHPEAHCHPSTAPALAISASDTVAQDPPLRPFWLPPGETPRHSILSSVKKSCMGPAHIRCPSAASNALILSQALLRIEPGSSQFIFPFVRLLH